MRSGPNHISAITYWEVVLKSGKGKLDVGDPRLWWPEALVQLGAIAVPLRVDHVAAVHGLPSIHQDPFDRVLIAQAMVESLTLLSTDRQITRYRSERFQVIS